MDSAPSCRWVPGAVTHWTACITVAVCVDDEVLSQQRQELLVQQEAGLRPLPEVQSEVSSAMDGGDDEDV